MSTKTKKLIDRANILSQTKKGFGRFFSNNAFVLLAFIIPFAVMLLNFAIKRFAPFGDRQILVIDLWHQYYPFLVDFQDKLISGSSLIHSWTNGMGGNYLALMSYYVASPINFLTVFIPASFLREFLMLSVCVEIGCAAGFMAIFLKKTFHQDGLPLVFFSAGYGFCAFFMGYYWNVIWLNTVAMLPLVALGMISLWREGKFCLYTITLALSVIANYYVGYFACIFVALSFVGYSIIYWNGVKDFFGRLGRTVLFSAIGLMITAFLTLPAYNALGITYSSGSNNAQPEYWRMYYDWSEILSQSLDFVTPSTKENLPNIACGVAAIFFGLIFLTARKVNWRAKIFSVALLAFIVISFNVNVLDYIWHGMHFTNMIPHRFAYLFSFVLLTIAYRAYTLIDRAKIWDVLIGFFGSMMLVVISTLVKSGVSLWGSAILISFIALATALYVFKIYPRVVLDIIVLAVVCLEIFAAGFNGIKAVGSTSTENYPEGEEVTRDVINAMNTFEANTTDMWRGEMTTTQTLNDASLNGYNGISQFSSMSNVSVTKFLEEFGCQGWQSGNRYTYRESTPVTNLFLNVKYLISRSGSYAVTDYVEPCYQNSNEVLLKNKYYLPMGFVTDKSLLDYSLEDRDPDDFSQLNAFDKQNEFFSLATGVDEDVMTVIEPAGINNSLNNQAIMTINKQFPGSIHGYDYNINTGGIQQAASIDIIYNVTEPGVYCVYGVYYGTSIESKVVTVKRDGASVLSGCDISRPYIMNAGKFEAGQQLSVSIESFPAASASNFVCLVAKVNDDVFSRGYNKLAENTLVATNVTDTEIDGEINSSTDGLFYTSVVNDGGWSVTVDGEKTETKKVGGAMLAFEITKGKHTVEMSYSPPGYIAGSVVSILGIIMLIAASFLYRNHLSKTFLFKYKTHPYANPCKEHNESALPGDGIKDNAFVRNKSRGDYLKKETPVVTRIVLSVVLPVIYFLIWLGSIMKKIKILAQEAPDYTRDIVLSLVVPFYFAYVVYKYGRQKENLASGEKLRITSAYGHMSMELAASGGFIVALIVALSSLLKNINTYLIEKENMQNIAAGGGTPPDFTVSLVPSGTSLTICIFCLLAGFILRIGNLYLFDQDIIKLAKKKFPPEIKRKH